MNAVAYRLRSLLRSRLSSTLGLTLVIAAASAIVLAFAAGAHRTLTAPDRYTKAVGGSADVELLQEAPV